MLWGFRHAIYLNNPSARQDTVLHPPFASPFGPVAFAHFLIRIIYNIILPSSPHKSEEREARIKKFIINNKNNRDVKKKTEGCGAFALGAKAPALCVCVCIILWFFMEKM